MSATLAGPRVRVVPVVYADMGSLQWAKLQWLERHLYSAVGDGRDEQLVVDCRVVDRVGAAFLGALARLDTQARRAGGEVVVVQLSERCRRVFAACGLGKLCQAS